MLDEVYGEIERFESPYNSVVVHRVGERVDLEVEGATYATWHPRYLLTGYSWDALTAAALLRAEGPPARVLLLGLGGGTVTRQLRHLLPRAELVAVEIDAAVIEAAKTHMDVESQGVTVVEADAYAYLAEPGPLFDVIIDDLYLTGPNDVERAAVPAGPVMTQLRARLAEGGVLVANFITDEGHQHVQREGRDAFCNAFDCVQVITPPRGLNEILVGGEALLPAASLQEHQASFTEATDAQLWSQLSVQTLQPSARITSPQA